MRRRLSDTQADNKCTQVLLTLGVKESSYQLREIKRNLMYMFK